MAKRKNLGNSARFKVFQRDGFRCQYCGRTPPAVVLQVDHIIPVAEGGGNEESNLVTACSDCNHGKNARIIDASTVPRDYVAMAQDAKAKREQLAAYRRHLEALRWEMERAIDFVGEQFFGENLTWSYENNQDRRGQVERFINLLGLEEVARAARIAQSKVYYDTKRFSYFCGVCWNRATELGLRAKPEQE